MSCTALISPELAVRVLKERLITVPQDPVSLLPGATMVQILDPSGIATMDQCEAVLQDVGL